MKEASLKWLQVHDSNFMIFWKRQNYGDSKKKKKKKNQQLPGVMGKEGMKMWVEQREFLGQWNYCMKLIVDICHLICHFSKLKERTAQRVNPCVKYGLLLIIMYQHWLINCNKCATIMQNVNNRWGGLRPGWEWGGKWELSTFCNIFLQT